MGKGIDKLDFIKIKQQWQKHFSEKDNGIRRQPTEWNICKRHTIKECYPKYTNKFKLNSKETNKPIKNKLKSLKDISPMTIHRWQVSIWKDASHHKTLGNAN